MYIFSLLLHLLKAVLEAPLVEQKSSNRYVQIINHIVLNPCTLKVVLYFISVVFSRKFIKNEQPWKLSWNSSDLSLSYNKTFVPRIFRLLLARHIGIMFGIGNEVFTNFIGFLLHFWHQFYLAEKEGRQSERQFP